MPVDLAWAEKAIQLNVGKKYQLAKTSAFFYDNDALFEFVNSLPDSVTVSKFIANFDGCTGKKVRGIVGGIKIKTANKLTKDDTGTLLKRLRALTIPAKHKKLGSVGKLEIIFI